MFFTCSTETNKTEQEQKPNTVFEVKIDDEIQSMINEISPESLEAIIEKLVSFGTRHSLSETQSDTFGIGAARRWVKDQFEEYAKESNGRMIAELDPYIVEPSNRIPYPVEMKNAMATLKGTDPNDDRVFVISGHLDSRVSDVMDSASISPGANDDASGVAIVMELAKIMAKRAFPSTIIFVAVQGEEQGLFGSTHLANSLKEDSVNVVAMLNNDIVGNSLSSETNIKNDSVVRVFSESIPSLETEREGRIRQYTGRENDSPARLLARYAKEFGEAYNPNFSVKLIYRNDRYLRGGDHTPFVKNGYSAIRFCEINEHFERQHQDLREEDGVQYGDLEEFLDYGYMARIASVNLAALANLALAPYKPQDVGLKTSLSNFTTLIWNHPSKGVKPKSYEVLVRDTDEPMWSKKIMVQDTFATLDFSKDNYLFSVRSVDSKGHASLPVFPVPVR